MQALPAGLLLFYRTAHCQRENYSMIDATVPDPTVRPPTRYQTEILNFPNRIFQFIMFHKITIFHCFYIVFKKYVIIVLSHLGKNSVYFL